MAQFTSAQLVETQLKADVIWKDSQLNAFYKAEVEGLKAIRDFSAATISPLEDVNKNYIVSINWVTTNNLVLSDGVADNCNPTGPQVDSAKKNYILDIFKKVDFSITEQQLRNTVFSREEVAAKAMLEAMRLLDEGLATVCMAKADAYAGSNLYLPAQSGYAETLGKTQIPVALPAVNLFAYLDQTRILNRMRGAYLIENGSLYQKRLIAAYNSNNLNGQGDQAAFGSLKIVDDLFNMAAAGLTTDALLIAPTALAFASKARFSLVPDVIAGRVNQTHYKVESPSLKGVFYDVIYEMDCAPGVIVNDSDVKHTWRIMANAGLFLNPTRTVGNTGVLALQRF